MASYKTPTVSLPLVGASIAALVLSACVNTVSDSTANVLSSASSSTDTQSEATASETRNVSYQGTVRSAGMSIYMQGTHRLELEDGRFVLLESEELDLDRYVDKKVAVLGSVRPTVEEGSFIMRVEQITQLEAEEVSSEMSSSSQSSSDQSASEVSSAAVSSAPSSIAVSVTTSAARSVQAVSSAAPVVSSAAPVVSSAPSSAAASVAMSTPTVTSDFEARTAIMAKAKMDPSVWTQKYCSTHLSFCFPVHKNWWFKSFGATTSYLWHVEISTEDIMELGQGPLVVNMMSGDISATGQADGAIVAQGDFVVGYKAWTDGRHFEVSAPKSLQSAVAYIIANIQPQQ